jgi:Rrf2 family nitric oxide-sensitive transcriptional repressor
VLIYLAAEPGRRATVSEICAAFGIKENHLTKVVHFLGKRGFLSNVRGRGGGLALSRPAREIGIADVVREAEGTMVPAECFDAGAGCVILPVCRLRGVLADAMKAFYDVLAQYTLEDMLGNRAELAKILFAARH